VFAAAGSFASPAAVSHGVRIALLVTAAISAAGALAGAGLRAARAVGPPASAPSTTALVTTGRQLSVRLRVRPARRGLPASPSHRPPCTTGKQPSVTPATPAPNQTAWLPQQYSWNDMNAAAMQYERTGQGGRRVPAVTKVCPHHTGTRSDASTARVTDRRTLCDTSQ
jgi:hypothetical protein